MSDDPDDNKFVECALEGHADYIVSRDGDLLRLKQYEGVRIVDDAEFLKMVASPGQYDSFEAADILLNALKAGEHVD